MKRRALAALAACCATLYGCQTLPEGEAPSTSPQPGAEQPPALDAAASRLAPLAALLARHHALAQRYAREQNWADALVQWELLALLKPDAQEYRDAIAQTRTQIATRSASLMQMAEQARKQGKLDQAEMLYLRVLNLDRENSAAAHALRELDMERARRAYTNRPPRMRM